MKFEGVQRSIDSVVEEEQTPQTDVWNSAEPKNLQEDPITKSVSFSKGLKVSVQAPKTTDP